MKKTISKKVLTRKPRPVKQKPAAKTKKSELFMVGIGASAGGLEALKLFFDNASSDSGMAFIVVQHLDPTHKSLLTELISGHTKMKVLEITDGLRVKPDHVYIIPPNKDLKIINGMLQLMAPGEKREIRRPIDRFFRSLAADQKEKAIGIVLSGTGTEGTLGLKIIKAEGGMSIAQEPHSAQFAGMPQNAISANAADYILMPEEMPAQLVKYINGRAGNIIEAKDELTAPLENQLNKIFLIIRNQTGYDFSNYKINTILRRITKRMALNQIDSLEDYISFLRKQPGEVEKLFRDFLIGVTSFFRDKEVFSSIESKAIPHLLKICRDKQVLRVWVCGCSTGEEAYSLAILFREALKKSREYVKVMIFASDIDKEAIEIARIGSYSESAVQDISATLLNRYFIRKENKYQLKTEIREMLVFAHHNLIKDPPFSKIDMITCRNLLIYMNSDLQKKILPVFHYSLNRDGILVLGTSESIGEHGDLFYDFDSKHKIFKKKEDSKTVKPAREYDFPFTRRQPALTAAGQDGDASGTIKVSGILEKYLLDQYTPPAVIIDGKNDIIYFSGNTGQFLKQPIGEAKLNILKMAKKGLSFALEDAIKKVRAGKNEFQVNGIDVKVNDHFLKIDLILRKVPTRGSLSGAIMVIFDIVGQSVKNNTAAQKLAVKGKRPGISDMEKELKITQENLQATANELDIARKSLQSSNEEFQSSNEELQSSNEELETSREELQSVNEELITVNNELENKIEQLSQSNDDLNNLLSSIDVATVFLDRDLNIKRFTPTATKIFNLIPSDINRPVAHLSANIVYDNLINDVKDTINTLSVKKADIQAKDGTWYHMRIMPYRTAENIIEGVLLTFVEITEIKNVEEVLKKTNEHLNLILENLPAVPFTCINDTGLVFSFVGKSCEKVTGFLPEQLMKNTGFWIKRLHPDDKRKTLAAFAAISKKGSLEHNFRWKCADGKYKSFTNYIRYARAEKGREHYIVGVWQEIGNTLKGLKK